MKITFALVEHLPNDDRVWYQQSQALFERAHEVFIISVTNKKFEGENFFYIDKNLTFSQKINNFYQYFSIINPDVFVCDNPLSILAASRYKRKNRKKQIKIYYDITEWHPSKSNFHNVSKIKKIIKIPLLCGISFYASWLVSGFIFGEYYKSIPYKLFFWKKSINLSYYADLKQIKTFAINENNEKFILFFAGKLNEEWGFNTILTVAKQCAEQFPNTDFLLRAISRDYDCEFARQLYGMKNLKTEILPLMNFEEFCAKFGEADIFFDLRKIDFENSHSLPIKLFYYMAAGHPVVFSNLKAIRKGVPEIDEFGFLVNPKNIKQIADIVVKYLLNKQLYEKHCYRARQLCEEKYNWENIKNKFIEFVENT